MFILYVYENNSFVLEKKNNCYFLPLFDLGTKSITDLVIEIAQNKLGANNKPLLVPSTIFIKKMFENDVSLMPFCASIDDFDLSVIKKNGLEMIDLDFIRKNPRLIDNFTKIIIDAYREEKENECLIFMKVWKN